MSLYGEYETLKEIAWSNGATLYSARKDGSDNYIIKVYPLAFFGFAGDDQGKAEKFAESFNGRIDVQQKAAAQTSMVTPVLKHGFDHDSAWCVTHLLPNSVQKLVEKKTVLTKDEYFKLFTAIAQSTVEFRKICGRSHGNLKATNIFLKGEGKTTLDQIILSDPAAGDASHAAECELADLRGIGETLHRLVINEDREEEYWTLPPPPSLQEWIGIFGKDAEAWHSLCTRLLAPDLTIQNYDLDELIFDLARLKSKPKFSTKQLALAAAAVVVLLGLGGFAVMKFSGSHTDNGVTEEKFATQASRLSKERREAEQRADVELKARQAAEQKAETQTQQLTEAKRQAELHAAAEAKARQESERKAEAQERALAESKAREQEARKRAEMEEAARTAALEEQKRLAALTTSQPASNSQSAVPDSVNPTTTSTTKAQPAPGAAWSNSLGMLFVPAGPQKTLFCAWETRRKDFERFVKYTSRTGSAWRTTTFRQKDSEPVVNIDVDDAQAFCKWLTELERQSGVIGKKQAYRLPTDSEWTEATGLSSDGVDGRTFGWGPTLPPPAGTGNLSPWCSYDRYQFTAPVAQFTPNSLGVYDMIGNVWEICLTDNNSSPHGRGGSWQTESPAELGILYRLPLMSGEHREDVGFRCVLDLE